MHLFFDKNAESNEKRIERVILKNYNRYYRLAFSYVHNEADANDIVQNGAYKALKNVQTLKKKEYAETWVYRIMLNECFRYAGNSKFLSYEAMQEENVTEPVCTEDHYADIDLQRALDTLCERDKAVIILKYFEDRTLSEIAVLLSENENTVKSRLYRSLKKLRQVLCGETPPEKRSPMAKTACDKCSPVVKTACDKCSPVAKTAGDSF